MKKRSIIIFIIILLIISLLIFFFYDRKKSENEREQIKPSTSPGGDIKDSGANETEAGGSGEGSGGGGGGQGTTTTATTTSAGDKEGNNLPSDLYTRECGYYFDDYGVCGGTCPSGTCTSEGRSCYCKLT